VNLSRIKAAPSRWQVSRQVRESLALHLYDECPGEEGHAIYTLSDPRNLRIIRYVGQTALPERRFRQHLATARLWMPDEVPWWIRQPRLRPLYEWIRALYLDGCRLPVMVVVARTDPSGARIAEREWMIQCLARDMPLLNVEPALKDQLPLDPVACRQVR